MMNAYEERTEGYTVFIYKARDIKYATRKNGTFRAIHPSKKRKVTLETSHQ